MSADIGVSGTFIRPGLSPVSFHNNPPNNFNNSTHIYYTQGVNY